MDWESGKQRLTGCLVKYRYLILILLAGIMILTVPEKEKAPMPETSAQTEQQDLQNRLEDILGKISGVGRVQVLLTEASGSDTVYQVDENRDGSDLNTVTVMNAQREELGLIKQVLPPRYRGALIVCQGADRAGVRLAVVDAVKSVTGLSSDRITVLKMK